jgi:hypothetical protein
VGEVALQTVLSLEERLDEPPECHILETGMKPSCRGLIVSSASTSTYAKRHSSPLGGSDCPGQANGNPWAIYSGTEIPAIRWMAGGSEMKP